MTKTIEIPITKCVLEKNTFNVSMTALKLSALGRKKYKTSKTLFPNRNETQWKRHIKLTNALFVMNKL